MLGWILRIILLIIVLRLIWRFLASVIDGVAGRTPQRPASGRPEAGAVPLVKDPVCGTFVVKQQALAATADGQTAWFCSERCREQWRASRAGSRPA